MNYSIYIVVYRIKLDIENFLNSNENMPFE